MKDYIRINQQAYDTLAEEYKQRVKKYIVSDKELALPFINYLNDNFNSIKVLELGPGSGLNLSYFEKEGFETFAVDISRNIIKISQELAPKTKFIYGDFLEYDFNNQKFEGIFAKAFIHLFPKDDAILVLRKIYELLENNGITLISTTVHDKSHEGYTEKTDYKNKAVRFRKFWIEEELIQEVKNAGFNVIRKYYHVESDLDKKWVNLIATKI